jgi:arylsulfatase A-like enzyme
MPLKIRCFENSYLVITADRGELFERGEHGHVTRLLYDAVVHIPLLVLAQVRRSAVTFSIRPATDLVPTPKIAEALSSAWRVKYCRVWWPRRPGAFIQWKEGMFFFGNLGNGVTISMIKGEHKLIYYTGYAKRPDTFELYNLKDDIEEVKDLYLVDVVTASQMKEELLDNFEANRKIA